MNPKIFWLITAILLPIIHPAAAQQPTKIPRIGYLSSRIGMELREEAFLKGLRELGYVEGKNIEIEWRFAKGNADHVPELAADLVRLKLDCIVVGGTESAHAVKRATSTIPIVIGNVGDDPVRQGFVASLARPGGNITGFTMMSTDLAGKRVELLKETFPKVARLAILWDGANRSNPPQVRETEAVGSSLGLKVQSVQLQRPSDFENGFRAAGKGRADALVIVAAGLHPYRSRIVVLEVKMRVPVLYTDPAFVPAGGLMSYSGDIPEQFRRAATYVDKILKGAKPADLPVEQPTKFELVINLKTAKQIGLTIPPNVLARADRVIR
jgi:putative ABC transport system substrate-binding protein